MEKRGIDICRRHILPAEVLWVRLPLLLAVGSLLVHSLLNASTADDVWNTGYTHHKDGLYEVECLDEYEGSKGVIKVGKIPTTWPFYYLTRGYARFDTSSIPDNATILSVELELTLLKDSQSVSAEMRVRKVDTDPQGGNPQWPTAGS